MHMHIYICRRGGICKEGRRHSIGEATEKIQMDRGGAGGRGHHPCCWSRRYGLVSTSLSLTGSPQSINQSHTHAKRQTERKTPKKKSKKMSQLAARRTAAPQLNHGIRLETKLRELK